tara:strand:- start:275 stop:508 length:234 start_codon:yes stop_codon:yes gene_type:complete
MFGVLGKNIWNKTPIGMASTEIRKRSRGKRYKINNGIPSVRKMKQGQMKFCVIKQDLYLVMKHKNKLYKLKFSDTEL